MLIVCLERLDSKNRSKQVQYITYIGTIVFAIVIGYIILMSGNISNKFAADNGSLMDRTTDIRTALSVILYNPFAGIGLGSTGLSVANAQTVSATTLLAIAEYFGIPFMIYYAYRFFQRMLSTISTRRNDEKDCTNHKLPFLY